MRRYLHALGKTETEIVSVCYDFASAFDSTFGSLRCFELRPTGFSENATSQMCENLTCKGIEFSYQYILRISRLASCRFKANIQPVLYAGAWLDFSDELLSELLRIFNNSALDEVGGDIIGRIYEYFLNKFAKNIASDDGVFFTPKSLVKMIVKIIEPQSGILLDMILN